MNKKIKRALEIANSYREEHDGEIPVLIVAHTASGREQVFVGEFRKKHETQDQKTFCSALRIAFILNNVTSYELLIKPVFKYTMAGMTKNILAIVTINGSDNNEADFFEIEDDDIVPYVGNLPVEGMFTQLLPTDEEREHEFQPKVRNAIELYTANCTYEVKEAAVSKPRATQSAADILAASM